MKTLFKYEFTIQIILIIILLLSFATYIYSEDRLFSKIFIVDFFILAFIQYGLNITKFFNKKYLQTDFRNFYIYAATFVVITYVIYLLAEEFNAETLMDILGAIGITWIILSPILIFISLYISWFDAKNIEKQNLID
ncbi:hypothetical protein [Chryseobacterium wangxinyae]|uniref:hypothetical protein n=1 Tax=Chryseobacterium sp. CY353 TaxID=2997334 RepID=UPI0022702A9D|nr:hypothetical protein [Chryseobacterium sp. CY353]MCY0969303.1 hypothetical protein [Chryseobacterium sp. CY353]